MKNIFFLSLFAICLCHSPLPLDDKASTAVGNSESSTRKTLAQLFAEFDEKVEEDVKASRFSTVKAMRRLNALGLDPATKVYTQPKEENTNCIKFRGGEYTTEEFKEMFNLKIRIKPSSK